MDTIQNTIETLAKPHWSAEQTQNGGAVVNFVQTLMNNHDFETIRKHYTGRPYKQHNRSMTDGIEGVLKNVSMLTKRFPDFAYDIKNVQVDGDLVTIHAHATINKKHRGNDKKGLNIIDTWRVENGKLTEHWDAVQPLDAFQRMYYWLTGGSVMNANGVF